MGFRWSCHIVFGLFFLLQHSNAGPEKDDEKLLLLQLKVESLIEKIITYMQDYYYAVKEDVKCIPECITEALMEILKTAIDCIEENEKNLNSGRVTAKMHSKNFLGCFSKAKTEIRDAMSSINTSLDYCPDTITEKTYQINVTTTFTKTFNINIKNGVEITKKAIELRRGEEHWFDRKTGRDDDIYLDYDAESSEQTPDDQNLENFTEKNIANNPEEEVKGATENHQTVTEESGISATEGYEKENNQQEYYEYYDELEVDTRIMKDNRDGELEEGTVIAKKVSDDGEDDDPRYIYTEQTN